MGRIKHFDVILDKYYNPTYYPGEKISGKLKLIVNKDRVKIDLIKFQIKGQCLVNWTNKPFETGDDSIEGMFSESEEYLNIVKIIYEKQQQNKEVSSEKEKVEEKDSSSNDFILDIGEYTYPFSFDLPTNTPETFEHSYGMISYFISAFLDLPTKATKVVTKEFVVLSNLNVRLIPELNVKSYIKNKGNLSCCSRYFSCCAQNIVAEIGINKCGFSPGEMCMLDVLIKNHTEQPLDSFMIALRQRITFHTKTKTKYCNRTLSTLKINATIRESTNELVKRLEFKIPLIYASTTENSLCRLIKIEYLLMIVIDPKFITNTIIPITIGSLMNQEELNKMLATQNAKLELV